MLLSDGELWEAIATGELLPTPFDPDSGNVQSAGIDLRLRPIPAADDLANPVRERSEAGAIAIGVCLACLARLH